MSFINSLNDLLWSYVITVVLVGAAVYFTIRSKGVQFRFIGDGIRIIMGRDKSPHRPLNGAKKIMKDLFDENGIEVHFSEQTKVHRAMAAIGK